MKRLVLTMLLLSTAALHAQRGTSWKSELADRWQVLHISNGHLVIGIAPELGGRIVMLQTAGSDHNLLHLPDKAYLQRNLDGVPPHLPLPDFGGITILHAPWRHASADLYSTHSQQVEIDPIRIRSVVQHEQIAQVQVISMPANSTILRTEVTITNRGDRHEEVAATIGAALRRLPGDNERLPEEAGPDHPGAGHAPGGWLQRIDRERGLIHVLHYPREVTAGVWRPDIRPWYVWPAEVRPQPAFNDPGALHLRLVQQPRELAPGESTTYSYDQILYQGLTAIDLRKELTLMQITTDKPVYQPGERVRIRVGAARPFPGAPFNVTVSVGDQTRDLRFSCPQPGKAQWLEWELPQGFAEDGEHRVLVAALEQTARIPVVVDGAALAEMAEQVEIVERLIEEIAKRDTLAKRTEAAMARVRLQEARAFYHARDLGQAVRRLDALIRDLRVWLNEPR